MGVLPLEFEPGEGPRELDLSGRERFHVEGLAALTPGATLRVSATGEDGRQTRFSVRARLDTPAELEYYRHGGILPYVFRGLLERLPP
jgi:aconitate hydratase